MKRLLTGLFVLLCVWNHAEATLPYAGSLEIRGLDQLSAFINEFNAELGNQEEFDAAQQLAEVLGQPELPGVDRNGVFRIDLFLVDGFDVEPAIRLQVPLLENDDAFLDLLKEFWPQYVEVDQVLILSAPPTHPTPIPMQELFVQVKPTALHIANRAAALPLAADTLDPLAGVWALTIHPATLTDAFLSQMEKQREMMESMFEHMSPEERAAMGIDLDQDTEHQEMVFGIFRAFRQLALSVNLGSDTLEIQSLVRPTPNTPIAELAATLRTPSDRFKALFPDNALWAHVVNMQLPDSLIDLYLDFFRQFADEIGDDGETVAFLEQSLDLFKGLYGGDIAIMALPGSEDETAVEIAQAWRITDVDTARAALTASLELTRDHVEAMDTDADDVLTLTEPRTHREIIIEGYSMDATLGDPDMTMLLGMHAPILQEMDFEYAFVDDVMLSVMGTPETMNELIDRYLDGAIQIMNFPAVETLLPNLHDDFVELGFIQPVELLNLLHRMVPSLPLEWLHELTDGQMAIAGYSRLLPEQAIHSVVHMDVRGLMEAIGAVQESFTPSPAPTMPEVEE